MFLSINRFERKKDIGLAIRAFARMRRALPLDRRDRVHLVIAGGYDTRVAENVDYFTELMQLAKDEGLWEKDIARPHAAPTLLLSDVALFAPAAAATGAASRQQLPYEQVSIGQYVTFVRSFSDDQKTALLGLSACVLYTPTNEHFGIVPLECMAAARPVIACASGGPLESIGDGETGFLCEPTPESFCGAMLKFAADDGLATRMGVAGAARVAAHFSRDAFAAQLQRVCTRGAAARDYGGSEGGRRGSGGKKTIETGGTDGKGCGASSSTAAVNTTANDADDDDDTAAGVAAASSAKSGSRRAPSVGAPAAGTSPRRSKSPGAAIRRR